MRIQKIFVVTVIAISAALLCSCSSSKKVARPPDYYMLHYPVPDTRAAEVLPVTLSLEKLKTSPPYHTQRIVYSTGEFSQNKYYYHQWITTPDEMVTQLLTRDLIASGRFLAVMIANDGSATHRLNGTIDEFYEQDTIDGWNAVLSLTIVLIDTGEEDASARICFQKNYRKIYPCEQENPKSLARALSLALSEISDEIGTDIYQAVSNLE